MTGLIDLAPAPVAEDVERVNDGEIVNDVTGFTLRIGDGPAVTAALLGNLWSFAFHGKSNDDTVRLPIDHHEAVIVATLLARRLVELEPGRQSYELQRKALATWLKSLVAGEGGESL